MKTCKRGHQYEATKKCCPVCQAESNRRWVEDNKQQQTENMRRWYEANKTQQAEYHRTWKAENKAQHNENQRNYKAKRKANDPLYKLRQNISSLISMCFKSQGFKKTTKTANILGCDFETLKAHLIQTAKNNYGGKYFPKRPYHIDHKTPVATATTEQELLALNHYTNLQFLYPKDNLEKSDKPDWKISNEK